MKSPCGRFRDRESSKISKNGVGLSRHLLAAENSLRNLSGRTADVLPSPLYLQHENWNSNGDGGDAIQHSRARARESCREECDAVWCRHQSGHGGRGPQAARDTEFDLVLLNLLGRTADVLPSQLYLHHENEIERYRNWNDARKDCGRASLLRIRWQPLLFQPSASG